MSPGRQLEHYSRAPIAGGGRQASAVRLGDRGSDREPTAASGSLTASVAVAVSTPRSARQLGDGRRQTRAAVDDLDPDAVALLAATDLDVPSPVLDRVRDQVACGLRDPQPVAKHHTGTPVPAQLNAHAVRLGRRAPRLDRTGDELSELDLADSRQSTLVASAAKEPSAAEIVQRQRRPVQFQVDRSQAVGREPS